MTYLPPPPNPDNDPTQAQATLKVMGIDLRKIAQTYSQWKWLIGIAGRFGGFKVPKEVDFALETLAHGGHLTPDQEQFLQGYAQQTAGQYSNNPYGQMPQREPYDVPSPTIGEPVLTKDLAYEAWRLHHGIGCRRPMGTREIAAYFTEQGSPCSHSTIAKYVQEVDAEMEEAEHSRISSLFRLGKYIAIAVLWLISILFVKFVL